MILGTGIDIIEIERIRNASKNPAFVEKIFTDKEMEYLLDKDVQSMAGYFCAKEAVSKALGTGISGFSWRDIEVIRDGKKPSVLLHSNALIAEEKIGIKNIQISISHCKEYAVCMAIAEG